MVTAEGCPPKIASHWESIAAAAPDCTREMLNIANLLCIAEPDLMERFNSIAAGFGLLPVNHISDAIGQASSKFILVAEHDTLESTLDQFFQRLQETRRGNADNNGLPLLHGGGSILLLRPP